VKYRFHGTFRDTSTAIDALGWIDVKLIVILIEAVDRTDHHAIGVLAVVTRLANDQGHESFSFQRRMIDTAVHLARFVPDRDVKGVCARRWRIE
jgi:hypothetical protein